MSEKIRVGIIGAGGIVKSRHLPGLQKIDHVEVIAVCNRRSESTAKIAADYGIPKTYQNWRDLIADDEIDVIFIGTPPYLHAEATIVGLEADKHVFCQARMAMNFDEAKAMFEASQKTDRKTMLCPVPVGIKGGALMRQLIDSNYLGQIYHIQMTAFNDWYSDLSQPLSWRQDPDLSGINVLTLGMWSEVLHRWVGYADRISAISKVHIKQRRVANSDDWAEIKMPDTIGVVAEMKNGATAVLSFSGVSRFAGNNRCEIYGSHGTIVYDLTTDEIFGGTIKNPELKPITITPELDREWTVEADFISAIRHNTPVSPSFYAGLKYMEFTEAVARSAREDRVIELPLE